MEYDFDLIVIGSGPAGQKASDPGGEARQARRRGAADKVAALDAHNKLLAVERITGAR